MWFDGGKGYLVPGTVVKSHPQGGLVVRSTEASEQVRNKLLFLNIIVCVLPNIPRITRSF